MKEPNTNVINLFDEEKENNIVKFKDLSKKKKITIDEILCLLDGPPALVKFDIKNSKRDGTLKPFGLKDCRPVYDVEDVIHWASTYKIYPINVSYLNSIPNSIRGKNMPYEKTNIIDIKRKQNCLL